LRKFNDSDAREKSRPGEIWEINFLGLDSARPAKFKKKKYELIYWRPLLLPTSVADTKDSPSPLSLRDGYFSENLLNFGLVHFKVEG